MSADVAIDAWLTEQGYGLPATKSRAREALETGGLTRTGKLRISEEKLPRAHQLLESRFCLHCPAPECVSFARGSGREPLLCNPKSSCARCGGSDNRRAATELIEACRVSRILRVVVVGGSPAVREELEATLGTALELRLVDGTERRTIDHARADMEWGDLVLLWGASELHHKVSMQYTNLTSPDVKRKLVRVQQRGVAALLQAAGLHLKLR